MYSTLQIYTMALFFRSLQFCNCTLFLLMNSADLKNKTNCNPLNKHAAGLFFMEPSPKPATKNTSGHPINSRKRIMGFHITCTATSQRVKRALNLIVLFSSNTSKNVKILYSPCTLFMHKTSNHEWNLAKSYNNQQCITF